MMPVLWRAAEDDSLPPDCAAFAEDQETAELYLSNRGYGGDRIWRTSVQPSEDQILDLTDPGGRERLVELVGYDAGAIGLDEWVPDVAYELREAGYLWVLVPESYPAGTTTWLYVGGFDSEPQLEAVNTTL